MNETLTSLNELNKNVIPTLRYFEAVKLMDTMSAMLNKGYKAESIKVAKWRPNRSFGSPYVVREIAITFEKGEFKYVLTMFVGNRGVSSYNDKEKDGYLKLTADWFNPKSYDDNRSRIRKGNTIRHKGGMKNSLNPFIKKIESALVN